jgi:hypothetical protein
VTDIINWKAELKKIEREYDTHGASGDPRRKSAERLASTTLSPEEWTNGAMLRIGLSFAVAIGLIFWPYTHDCGSGLFYFLGAAAAVVIGGLWSVFWTWRGRMPRAHAVSLIIVLWGLTVSAGQVLPRTGVMAFQTGQTIRVWFCPGYSPKEIVEEIKRSR